MSDLHNKLAQSGDHHHSHGIIHMMIEGAMIGGVTALLAHLVSSGMSEVVDKWQSGQHHPVDTDALRNAPGRQGQCDLAADGPVGRRYAEIYERASAGRGEVAFRGLTGPVTGFGA
ncbi:MAG: hypothetical protein WDN06_23095 [Asticcacaulis sp.]